MSRKLSLFNIYCRLLRHARPYWGHIAATFVLSLFAGPIALLAPVPLKIAADCVIGGRPLPGPLAAVVPTFTSFGVSENVASLFRELYQSIAEGKLVPEGGELVQGKTELETTLRALL